MEPQAIAKLRRNQELRKLPGGREGVQVSVQYKGDVPPLPRPERKEWLMDRFEGVEKQLSHLGVHFEPETLSVSGQTIEAVCDVNSLDELRQIESAGIYAVNLVRKLQVTD